VSQIETWAGSRAAWTERARSSYRVGVERLGETGRERGQHPFGTITGAVEPAVYPVLDPGAERAEQGRGDQRGAGHRHRGRDLDDLGSQRDAHQGFNHHEAQSSSPGQSLLRWLGKSQLARLIERIQTTVRSLGSGTAPPCLSGGEVQALHLP
jgi:hypothetical protein